MHDNFSYVVLYSLSVLNLFDYVRPHSDGQGSKLNLSTMSSSPARRRTLDFVKPEQSLADWSSKIRELQEQVDRDEALEQQLLEEEIARSRLERTKRRNTAGSALGPSHPSNTPEGAR